VRSFRRHLPSFLRSEEAGEEPLGEPQQHTGKGPPDLISTILQGVEGHDVNVTTRINDSLTFLGAT